MSEDRTAELAAKMAELANRFRAGAKADAAAIDEAMATGDRGKIAACAHRLAGNAGMFGHHDVTQAALELEEAAEREGDLTIPVQHLIALLHEV